MSFNIQQLKTKEIVGGVVVLFNVNGARYGLVKRGEFGVSLVDENGRNISAEPEYKSLYQAIVNYHYP